MRTAAAIPTLIVIDIPSRRKLAAGRSTDTATTIITTMMTTVVAVAADTSTVTETREMKSENSQK